MRARKEATSGSRRDAQVEARRRRRELLADGQSYWTDPTPLRAVRLPGEDEEELEFDEDALMAEFLAFDEVDVEFDEDALMAEFLAFDGDESCCLVDGQLTEEVVAEGQHDGGDCVDLMDAMIDPMLFDPRVLLGTAVDGHDAVVLLAEEEEPVLVVGAGLSPDVMTEDAGAASDAGVSAEVRAHGGDSAVVGVVGVGEVVALDEAPLAEVVAVDSDEAPYMVVADDSDEAQALWSEVAGDSNEAPRIEDGGSDEAPHVVVAGDSDEAILQYEVVADDYGASTLPSSFTWGMAALSDVADVAAVTDALAEVDAVEAVDGEVDLTLEGDGAEETGEVAELEGGSELDSMTVDSDLGTDVVREAADLDLDAGVACDTGLGDGTDLDSVTFDSDLKREVTEEADHDAGAAEIAIKLEDSPELDLMPLDSDLGMDTSDDDAAHLDDDTDISDDDSYVYTDSDLDSMTFDLDLEDEVVYDASSVEIGIMQYIESDGEEASDDEIDGDESTESDEAPSKVVASDSDDGSSGSMAPIVQPEPVRGQQAVERASMASFAEIYTQRERSKLPPMGL